MYKTILVPIDIEEDLLTEHALEACGILGEDVWR